MSDEKPSVIELINAVQREVTSVSKDDVYAAGSTRYNFRGVDRVVKALSGSMRKHGLVMVPHNRSIPEMLTAVTPAGKTTNVCRINVMYWIYGPAGDHVEVQVPGEAFDSGDKSVSKAMSVAWRIALLQTFFLPTDEPDPDSENYDALPAAAAGPRAEAQTRRLAEYDQRMTEWSAAADAASGDLEALRRLYNEAIAKKAPAEILDRIRHEGNELRNTK